eukprot:Nitzschia sp. Nitz4//scaffold84_size84139//61623//64081//NITZ4_005208-RA/size84139-augustus-gene-0.42-mRNA-1//1//CDS//3329559063//3087//frame0
MLSKDGVPVTSPEAARSESSASVFDPDAKIENAKDRTAADERKNLASRENRVIFYLRFIIFILFLLVALVSCISVFVMVKEEAINAFESEFSYVAATVLTKFVVQVTLQLDALDGMSIDYTSQALDHNLTFPFVTLSHMEYRGANTRISSQMVSAIYMPLVHEENRLEWERYALQHVPELIADFHNEEALKQAQDEKFGLSSVNVSVEDEFFLGDDEEANNFDFETLVDDRFMIWYPDGMPAELQPKPLYFPVWQYTPQVPVDIAFVNLDFSQYGFVNGSILTTLNSKQACIDYVSDFVTNDNDLVDARVFEVLIQSGQYRHTGQHYEGDPLSALTYPVFDSFDEDRNLAGIMYSGLYWRFLFSDILAENVQPILVVVSNSAGQVFTYMLDGPTATFVGPGDTHDPQYDYDSMSIDLAKYMDENASPLTQSFTAVSLNDEFLNYTLTVYPTDAFYNSFVTSEARDQAISVAGLFGFSFIVFLIYDFCIQRRQRIVMDRAVKATAVVGSLYPEQFREQIINDAGNGDQKTHRENVFRRGSTDSSKGMAAPPPLATKYPNCTVYFADLAGFTKWASTREPEQVFKLLETLYGAFDKIALRRGVFKVETVGDCYMAVTGLPVEQNDHAIRMAKFAMDCKAKLEEITIELTGTLGEGTDDLALRTGMHSGEVTAGVLRGEKGRFQLFGDTVNTASRMESTGIPRKIQVSQTTADALIVAGKESWLTPREEHVFAKGKGEMQTYFLHIRDSSDKSDETRTVASTTEASRAM